MPTYEYFCNSDSHHSGCGHEWEENLPIDERIEPMKKPCPKCGKKDQICRRFSSNLHHGVVRPFEKMDETFKENMRRIKKEHPEMNTSWF